MKHEGSRTVKGFKESGKKALEQVKRINELRKQAEDGNTGAALELDLLTGSVKDFDKAWADLQEAKLPEEKTKELGDKINNAAVQKVMKTIDPKDQKGTIIKAARVFLKMEEDERIPTGEQEVQVFWIFIMEYADNETDASLYEKALKKLDPIREKYKGNANADKFFKDKEARLEELKKKADKPEKDN
jgi:hypothetical protein